MRKTKQTNVSQILNLSTRALEKMTDEELRKVTIIANSAANKRIKRAEKAGLTSGIIEGAKEYGKFSVKGIETRAQLEAQFFRVRNFLNTKTSTVKGIKQAQKKMFNNLAKIVNKELPEPEKIVTTGKSDIELQNVSGLIWQQIDKLAENKSLGITRKERYKLAAHAYNVTTRDKRPVKTKQGLFKNLQRFYNDMYSESIQDKELGNLTSGEQEIAEIYNNIG